MTTLWVLMLVVCVGGNDCRQATIDDPVISHFVTEKDCAYVLAHVDAYVAASFTAFEVGGQLYVRCVPREFDLQDGDAS
jgi:hypothetical protein